MSYKQIYVVDRTPSERSNSSGFWAKEGALRCVNLPSTVRKRITRNLKANSDPLRTAYKETVYKVKSLIKIGISKPKRTILGKLKDHLKSKSAYKVDFFWDKWLPYKRFAV